MEEVYLKLEKLKILSVHFLEDNTIINSTVYENEKLYQDRSFSIQKVEFKKLIHKISDFENICDQNENYFLNSKKEYPEMLPLNFHFYDNLHIKDSLLYGIPGDTIFFLYKPLVISNILFKIKKSSKIIQEIIGIFFEKELML